MEALVTWDALISLTEPNFPKINMKGGRSPSL